MRRLALAPLLLTLLSAQALPAQVSQQSYLRNKPDQAEREDPRVSKIIEDAEKHFRLGELNLKGQKRQAALEEFNKAVETVLESGMDVRSNPRLNRYYLELVERVYRYEVPNGVPAQSPSQRAPQRSAPADVSLAGQRAAAGQQAEEYVSAVIEHAESQFELGQLHLKNNRKGMAKAAFLKAVDIVLTSEVSAKEHPGLRAYHLSLIDGIQKLGVGEEPAGPAGFTEQKFEPSPLDQLRELTVTAEEQSQPSPEPCGREGAARIELRGFRIGLTADAVRARLPGLTIPPSDKYGYAITSMNVVGRKVKDPSLQDVRRITLAFLDGKVSSVTLVYANTVNWESAAQFAQQVGSSMNLRGTWARSGDSSTYGDDVRVFKCERKSIYAGLLGYGRQRLPFVTVRDDNSDALVRHRVFDEAVRKAKAAEERRKAFKP